MSDPKSRHLTWDAGHLTREGRWAALGHRGATVWFTGLSGSGKSTVAAAVEAHLVGFAVPAFRLDGDNLRHGLCGDLAFSAADRAENIRRAGEVALLLAESGQVALASFISPYAADRDRVRARHHEAGVPFFEIHVATPLSVCEGRDPKGLYAKARAGELRGFTGVDDPYEAPASPELVLDTGALDVESCVAEVVAVLADGGIVPYETLQSRARETE